MKNSKLSILLMPYFRSLIQLSSLGVIFTLLSMGLLGFAWLEVQQTQKEIPIIGCATITSNEDLLISSTLPDSTLLKGERIFKAKCYPCHAATSDIVVGPGLKGITQRRSIEWIIRWTQNPKKVLESGDNYANNLYELYNRADMPAFADLSPTEIKSILAFINGG